MTVAGTPTARPAAAATAGVREVDFSWSSGEVRLAGELLLPARRGSHPAVIMLHGSGPATREDFRRQAHFLAGRGVAALIFDKRGSGKSGGDGDRYVDLTADARAGIRAISRRPEIRPGAIAVWGLSEGAFICPRAAAGNPHVAAIVAVGGTALVPARQQDWAVRNGLLVGGAAEVATRPVTTMYRLFADTDPDFRSDPGPWWTKVAQPVLAVWGANDELVPIRESARALRAHLEAGPNADRTFRTFIGASHSLAVGARDGNAIYAPGFLELTARWLRDRLSSGTSRRVVDTPLPQTNGVTVSRAIKPPAWHGTLAAQIAWAGAIVGMAVVALVLRSGVSTGAVVALIMLALVSLPAGLALTIADDGQGVATVAEYPVPLWPTVALTAASVAFAGRLLVMHGRCSSSRRQHAALAALSSAAALLVALMAYWLL